MSILEKQTTFARNVILLLDHIFKSGYQVTFGEAFRTHEQAELDVKEGKGILDSLHCKRLAIDINLFDANGTFLTDHSHYQQFGDFWETLNPKNRWGGNFIKYGGKLDDTDHFEMRDL